MPKLPFEPIPNSLADEVCARLSEHKRVSQSLPGGGALNIDRLLPFLCVYRRNPARNDLGTGKFVTAEASYLLATGDAPVRTGLKHLVKKIAQTAAEILGSFLIVEIWSGDDQSTPLELDPATGEPLLPAPGFSIHTGQSRCERAIARLEFSLQQIRFHRQNSQVTIFQKSNNHPAGMKPLLTAAEEKKIGCHLIGLEVRPIYRDASSGAVYERVLSSLCDDVASSLKKTFFTFALNQTLVRPQHYFSLGRSSLPKQVFTVDRQLAEVSSQFKFLLLVTPINSAGSWQEFSDGGFAKQPYLRYRPLDSDPMLLKRRLMNIATERIDDPTLAHVMRQTQDDLDRQITLLGDIGTRRFLTGSIQVFGGVDAPLLQLAEEILRRLPASDRSGQVPVDNDSLDAKTFARLANKEIKYYHRQSDLFTAKAIVRDDIYSGLLSTGGNLLIGRETKVGRLRTDALLQHEVGTHLVTYYNGAVQPLKLLRVGLAGYDALQEGLAVLSEYMVNGLGPSRLRTLAARVVATDALIRGEPFAGAFSQLVEQFGFEKRIAYTIVLRIYRGGGLTKDATYLRGLVEILDYIGRDGDLSPLFVGKIASDHIPVVQELLFRGVLFNPVLQPRYMLNPDCLERLQRLRQSSTVLDLIVKSGEKENQCESGL